MLWNSLTTFMAVVVMETSLKRRLWQSSSWKLLLNVVYGSRCHGNQDGRKTRTQSNRIQTFPILDYRQTNWCHTESIHWGENHVFTRTTCSRVGVFLRPAADCFVAQELKKRRVSDVVRVCESTYNADKLEAAGIKCHDWAFDDGTPPPNHVIKDWLKLLLDRFSASREGCIAIHCVAGLGRAPVLVAIALIELGMKYEEAVETIRKERRGAINAKQLQYLSQYKHNKRLTINKRHHLCTIH